MKVINQLSNEESCCATLLTGEDEALLVGRDSLLVLDLGLHVVDRVRGLDFEGDGLAGDWGFLMRAGNDVGSDKRNGWCVYR